MLIILFDYVNTIANLHIGLLYVNGLWPLATFIIVIIYVKKLRETNKHDFIALYWFNKKRIWQASHTMLEHDFHEIKIETSRISYIVIKTRPVYIRLIDS
jgi:hypothetical protein